MEQFTASEMRAEAHRHANEVEDMLNAAADLLEAQEKAVPVAYIEEYGLADRRSRGLVWADHPADTEGHTFTPLYTHPSPSDAERLADETALRHGWAYSYSGSNLYGDDGELQDNAAFPHIDWLRDSVQELHQKVAKRGAAKLAAHSAKAQPPANQDKPVYAISRSMHSYYTQDEEEARQAEFDGANVQRIPAQPPAASVTDGFVFERVNMGRGNERYVGLADGSEGTTVQEDGDGPGDTRSRLLWRIADAALAAQENPNGL